MKTPTPLRFFVLILTCTALLLMGCSGKSSSENSNASLTDSDGNTYTVHVMQDDRQWLMQNLNTNMPGSYCYNDSVENCSRYGRLYTWDAAKKGCEMLGEGWRLPTNEEWEQMAEHYGGIRIDSTQDGKEAYRRLIEGGDSQFNILFGGTRDPSGDYRRVEAHGFFWTATESDSAHAWFYNLGKGGQFVNRHHDGEKARAVSVRCIKR